MAEIHSIRFELSADLAIGSETHQDCVEWATRKQRYQITSRVYGSLYQLLTETLSKIRISWAPNHGQQDTLQAAMWQVAFSWIRLILFLSCLLNRSHFLNRSFNRFKIVRQTLCSVPKPTKQLPEVWISKLPQLNCREVKTHVPP